ncbi:MAG: MC/SLC25 family protein [Pseudomonadota bacterium]
MLNNTKNRQEQITFRQALFSGIVAGIAEVSANHPLWVIKTRIQRNFTPVLQRQGLYQGLASNMITMVPLIALRISLATSFQNSYASNNESKNYSLQLVLSALIGGSIPSMLSGPLEFIRTRQVTHGSDFLATYKKLIKKNGYAVLSTGLLGTMARDGIYTCGFFALVPILKKNLDNHFDSDWSASIASKLLAGAIAAFASQPLDTAKIEQQMNVEYRQISLTQAAKKIFNAEGIYGFFKGSTPRILRVISAVTIISTVNEKMEKNFKN